MWNVNEKFSQKAIESLAALALAWKHAGVVRGEIRSGAEFAKRRMGSIK